MPEEWRTHLNLPLRHVQPHPLPAMTPLPRMRGGGGLSCTRCKSTRSRRCPPVRLCLRVSRSARPCFNFLTRAEPASKACSKAARGGTSSAKKGRREQAHALPRPELKRIRSSRAQPQAAKSKAKRESIQLCEPLPAGKGPHAALHVQQLLNKALEGRQLHGEAFTVRATATKRKKVTTLALHCNNCDTSRGRAVV
ncbi:unnamed protein product [Symbiodinium natans]|uniref:Uncharacterized protein n=1 Tax=Symbiodinium natans TaxID=878477 RepID=A0A812QRX5_9DINO|nr:unnamed protein product [Symbiodinium natans]